MKRELWLCLALGSLQMASPHVHAQGLVGNGERLDQADPSQGPGPVETRVDVPPDLREFVQPDKRLMLGFGGGVGRVACFVTDEFPDDGFGTGTVYGVSVVALPPIIGLEIEWGMLMPAMELGLSRFETKAALHSVDEERVGTAAVTSLQTHLGIQFVPYSTPGIGVHWVIGLDWTRMSLEDFGSWDAEDMVFLHTSVGGDVFLSRFLSLSVDLSFSFGDFEITDAESSAYVDTYLATNAQLSGGLRFWL